MTKWFLCQQHLNDIIRYSSSEDEASGAKKYSDFLKFIHSQVTIKKAGEFTFALDKFLPLIIDLDTGQWQIYREEPKEATYQDLLNLNKEEESVDKFKTNGNITNTKKLINKLSSGKKIYG